MLKYSKAYFEKFVAWREKNLTEQQFVIILAFLTGLLGATAALV